MIIIAIIGAAIFLGILYGLLENAKSQRDLNKELQEIEEIDNQLRTSPPYKVGDLYYDTHLVNGMILSTCDDEFIIGRYVRFSCTYYSDTAYNICKGINPKYYFSSDNWMFHDIPTIQELEDLGRYYDTFMNLARKYKRPFKDIRKEPNSSLILSQTLTEDGKSMYIYDLKKRRTDTFPIENIFKSNSSLYFLNMTIEKIYHKKTN